MRDGPMVQWTPIGGSLHCVHILIVPLLTQMNKWVLVTEQEGGVGCCRGYLPALVFVYIQEFGFHVYLKHVKAKTITMKLLKIKGDTFRNSTYSKATKLVKETIIKMTQIK